MGRNLKRKKMKLTLKNDVTSIGKLKKDYGKAGDVVHFVNQRGNVMIVQNKSGDKFPIEKSELNIEK